VTFRSLHRRDRGRTVLKDCWSCATLGHSHMGLRDRTHRANRNRAAVVVCNGGGTTANCAGSETSPPEVCASTLRSISVGSTAGAAKGCACRRSRPPIPTDRDQLFRSIATRAARVLTAPLGDGCDVSPLWLGQGRREVVPVVNRRGPRATRRALQPARWRAREVAC
jgi:hypothetical protein